MSVYYGVVIGEELYFTAMLYTSLMLIMCFVYTIVILMLNKQMNELPATFKNEKISVNLQFGVFLFAYFLRFLENLFYLVANNRFEGFGGAAFILIGNLFDHILPLSFVLYQHHKVFKSVEILQ